MASPCTNRSAMNTSGDGAKARARLAALDTAMHRAITFTRPIRSAIRPDSRAPASMPSEPTVSRRVVVEVDRCHSVRRSGRA